MAKIDLNNFNVVKFGNVDIERNYINDILHAIVGKLNDLQNQIDAISGGVGSGGAPVEATYITAAPELDLPNSYTLSGEANVVDINYVDNSVEIGVTNGGISTTKLADDSVTIPKIDAAGTADSTTFLRGDGAWSIVTAATFIHTQSVSSASWVIVHNLGKYPSVFVEDTGGNDIEGEVVYDNADQITLNFSSAFTGTAYLN